MFDWGNWFIQAVIAAFFISGFVVFYNQRLLIPWGLRKHQRLNQHVSATIFVCVMVLFCLLAAYLNPSNVIAYYNWALYILFVPLLDEDLYRLEFGVRVVGIAGLWIALNSVHSGMFFFSLVNLVMILGLIYHFHTVIRKHLALNIEMITWIGIIFWVTQTQLTLVANVMGTLMFVLMNLFTTLYWSQERLANLERNQLQQQVNSDALTKAGSFFAFKSDSAQLFTHAKKNQTPLCLVMFDSDHFKTINDTYGHAAGNLVLAEVAKQVQAAVPTQLYRTGGEEFNLIFTQTKVPVVTLIQQVQQAIRDSVYHDADAAMQVTISVGVTELSTQDLSFEDTYERADANLYLSKRNGRDCITVDGQTLTS